MQQMINGALTTLTPEQEADFVCGGTATLAQVQAVAVNQVNQGAQASRQKYITVIAGQETTYYLKQLEAAALVNDPSATAAKYPYTFAEAAATGSTPAALAATVNATAAAWTAVNVQIESLRRGAIVAIGNATDIPTINSLVNITWP